jgi:hypothetical protein
MRSGEAGLDITKNSSLGWGERQWRLALTGLLAVYGVWCGLTPSRFHLPDALNLAIHETGHLVFAWGGDVLAALGGTLFQLILPLAFVLSFWKNQDRHAASVALWWVGQNFWNIARYIADARAQELPLVGGGEHDWTFLLATWGKLDQDLTLARDVRFVAWVIVLASVWWGIKTVASGEWAPPSGAPRYQATV